MTDKSKYYHIPGGGTTKFTEPDLIESYSVSTYSNRKEVYILKRTLPNELFKSQVKSQAKQYEIDIEDFERRRKEAEALWSTYNGFEQPEINERPSTFGYVYGWLHGGDASQLYVYENRGGWGITGDINKAHVFNSIEECGEHYLSKHSFPEQFRASLTNGYLKYFKADSGEEVRPVDKPWDDKKKLLSLSSYWKFKIEREAAHCKIHNRPYSEHLRKTAENTILAADILEAYCNTQSLQIVKCDNCHNPYFNASGQSKFCSSKCRTAHHRKNKSK